MKKTISTKTAHKASALKRKFDSMKSEIIHLRKSNEKHRQISRQYERIMKETLELYRLQNTSIEKFDTDENFCN